MLLLRPEDAGAPHAYLRAEASARVIGNTKAAWRTRAVPTSDLVGVQAPGVADARESNYSVKQCLRKRCWKQSATRDLLQLEHLEDALRAINDTTWNGSRCAQKAVEETV